MRKRDVVIKILFLILLLAIPLASAKSASDFQKGHMKLIAASEADGRFIGSTADLYLVIEPGEGRVFIESFPFTKLDTQISTRFANEMACDYVSADCDKYNFFYTIEAASTIIGGPSAGAAIAVLTASVLKDIPINQNISITGTINSGNLIGPVGSLTEKIDAAAAAGLKIVLIPDGERNSTEGNETVDIVDYGRNLGVDVIEVSELGEALNIFTGKNLSKPTRHIEIDPGYFETMKVLAERLCERGASLSKDVFYYNNESTNESLILDEARNYTERGRDAIMGGTYYTAASFCFTSNVRYHYLFYLKQNYSRTDVNQMISMMQLRVSELDKNLPRYETLTDLQSHAMVKERLVEADELLNQSRSYLDSGRFRDSLYNLAYANERIYSAESWSVFFGKSGKQFKISESIKESCLRKVSEAEERYQYTKLLIPIDVGKIRKEISRAYEYLYNGDYELCLFKASKAKAESDVMLSVFGVSEDRITSLINKKLLAAKANIVEEIEKGIFPIVGYSYYEYAVSLNQTDPYSALLYAEYALELSDLEIYFKTRTKRFELRTEWLIFGFGVIFGSSLTLLILIISKRQKRNTNIIDKKMK